ncbi:hypothetical protein BGZ54_008399 [Gamsiella multidivaricata]|nr:hypothetical protein BGZ54_008399 [Gamsiella multidivaricata]
MGDLLRIKPDLSVDLLEVITIVENEKVVRQALEVMWWIGMPCLGHHILGEKFYPLDYDSVLFMRQSLQEWQGAETMGAITRNNTVKSDTVFSFRKDFIDEHTTPRNDASARNNSVGSFGIRSKRSYRSVLPWKTANGAESIPLSGSLPQQSNNSATTGADFLADHELYPYMFSSPDIEDDDANNITHCERCELNMKGFGLYCYHCRGALHLECFYSIKKYAGVDCMQLGCALDLVSRRSRNQLIYPLENCGNKSHIDMTCRIRAGHQLQLVNLFSTCLCAACKLPLWGLHYQAYRCQECSQLMHAECKGTVQDCGVTSQPLTLRHSFPTQISYGDLKQSFQEFFRELIAIWETYHPTAPLSPATPSSTQSKDRYSYEEASCNASTLTLQLEVFKAGIARGEIQVQEWVLEGQITDESCIGSSGFELLTLQKHFVDLVRLLRLPGHSTAPTLFLSDFFEDKRPDPLLLFSCNYWSHFAALAKTMIKDAEATRLSYSHDPFSPPAEDVLQGDIFTTSPDTGQDQLLAGLSAQTSHVSLSTIFRFCMRRLCFHSTWTMQLVLQEWVKIGLLERLDGELCLFENAVQDPAFSPPAASLFPQFTTGIAPGLPTFQTSYFDSINGENGVNNSCIHTPTFRNVHCLFSMATAIDPTPDVENLIHAIWRCLSSVDLSVNECGFLLLSRRCWPDPFMSQYTTERLLGCVFHWLLLEDSHLFDIHKNYTSKGKRIPGVRSDLEEQIGMRRTALSANNRPPRLGGPAESSTAAIGATAATETSGNTTSSLTAVTGGTILSATGNSRSSSANSSLFGTVGSYVMTRKLMAKKFALPWLKKVMNLDQEGYVDMTYRQIRILEREMAPEMKEQYVSKEEQEKFRHTQSERYLESITKLRHAGFLFCAFSSVLCRWLEEVEEMLGGMDVSSKSFKTLNRLFMKTSARNGSGLGLGIVQGNTHSVLNGPSASASVQAAVAGAGGDVGGQGEGDNEWRNRLRARLQQGSGSGSSSPASVAATTISDAVVNRVDDSGETPLNTLRSILSTTNGQSKDEHTRRALIWLDLMVESGVQLPLQVFLDCCSELLGAAETSLLTPAGKASEGSLDPTEATAASISTATDQAPQPTLTCAGLLQNSGDFLRTCWEQIMSSAHRISEVEAGEILDAVLTANRTKILGVMGDNPTIDSKDLDR